MRKLKNLKKGIAWLLCLLLIGPYVIWPSAAAAQRPIKPVKLKVAILDFEFAKGVERREAVARSVADSMYVNLKPSRVFEVISREELEITLRALEISAPYTMTELEAIAEALELDGVVQGTIRRLVIKEDDSLVGIELLVKLVDAIGKEPINGSLVSVSKPGRPGFEGPVATLLAEAIDEACSKAAYEMAQQPLIQGTVLIVDPWGKITVNIGRSEGVKEGMRMVALRKVWDEEQRVLRLERSGMVKVVSTASHECICKQIGAGEIVPETQVRAIWEPPPARPGTFERVTGQNWGKILTTLVVVWAVWELIQDKTAALEAMTSINARASSIVVPGVELEWTTHSNLPTEPGVLASQIIGYIIYCSENQYLEGNVEAIRDVVIGSSINRYVDNGEAKAGTMSIAVDEDGIITVTPEEIVEEETALRAGVTRQGYAQTVTVNYDSDALVPGRRYYYAVQCISKWQIYGPAGGEIVLGTPPVVLTGLSISPESAEVVVNGIQEFICTAEYSDGSTNDVTEEAVWSVTEGLGEISAGVFTAGSTPGSGTVRATYEDLTASAEVTVVLAEETSARLGATGYKGSASRQEEDEFERSWVVALSELSEVAGPVTILTRPELISPPSLPEPGSTDISAVDAEFRWSTVAGGDRYILQIDDDISFDDPYEWVQTFPAAVAGVELSQIADWYGASEPGTYFWRVGVRRSSDPEETWPAPDGYVWSETRAFKTPGTEVPPPPPY